MTRVDPLSFPLPTTFFDGLKFFMALSFGLVFVVYMLRTPYLLFQSSPKNLGLVNEYYYMQSSGLNVLMDFVYISIYLIIAALILWSFKIRGVLESTLVVIATTIVLTGSFCVYFRSYRETDNFFSKWFHSIGYGAIKYDVFLLLVIYLVYVFLQDMTKTRR